MAKITKGRDFGGAVRYVTQDKKDARLLDSKGVLTTDRQSIINSFRLQSQLRPDVKVMVGHISLDFSKENVDNIEIPHLHFGVQLIFDESQKDGNNQIWIDVYELTKFLSKYRMPVRRDDPAGEYYALHDVITENTPD